MKRIGKEDPMTGLPVSHLHPILSGYEEDR